MNNLNLEKKNISVIFGFYYCFFFAKIQLQEEFKKKSRDPITPKNEPSGMT